MYFAWKDEYCIGIEEIDNQHRKLFEIGRRVSGMLFSNDASYSNEDIIKIIIELKEYTEFHFQTEELYMRNSGYVHFETHLIEHIQLIEKVRRMEEKYSETLSKDTLMELINLIYDWITVHILKNDKKLKELI